MMNYSGDFLSSIAVVENPMETRQSLSQYNSSLDRSTGSPDSMRSESSSQSTDSISNMILTLEKKATIMGTGRKSDKPSHSYIALISMAILSSNDNKMVLGDIYEYIMKKYPYYNYQDKAWRNSIRHNLSINECFIKNGRSDNVKGNYWSIHPACVEDFSKGDFRRRQARRRARKGAKDINRNYQPVNYGNPVFTPMTTSSIRYNPTPSPSIGHQPIITSPMYQSTTSASFGYQPMKSSAIGNFPFLSMIPGYQTTPSVTQSYHPYQRPVVSRQNNTQTRHDKNTLTVTGYPSTIQMSPADRFPFSLENLLNCNGETYSNLGLEV